MKRRETIIAMVAAALVASCSNDDGICEPEQAASARTSAIGTDSVSVEEVEQPYMTGLNGSAGSDDINNTVLDLYNFYIENSK